MLWAVQTSRARRAHVLRQPCERLPHVRGVGRNEQGMIEPASHERDVDVVAVAQQLGARRGDVLPILLAARIGVLGGRDEPDGAAQACRAHLPQRVGEQRVPVAHPDVDGKRMAGCRQTYAADPPPADG